MRIIAEALQACATRYAAAGNRSAALPISVHVARWVGGGWSVVVGVDHTSTRGFVHLRREYHAGYEDLVRGDLNTLTLAQVVAVLRALVRIESTLEGVWPAPPANQNVLTDVLPACR